MTLATSTCEPLVPLNHCVFRITGDTKFRARETKDKDGNQGIAIPSSAIKVAPLEAIGETIRSALAVAFDLPNEGLGINSFVFVSSDRQCYPVVEVKSNKPVCTELTQSVILTVLEKMKRSDHATQQLFPNKKDALAEPIRENISELANEFLMRYGDSPIATPATIFTSDNSIAGEIRGMYASKPDLSVLEPVLLTVEGCLDGYRARKREIYFDTKDESLLVHWECEDLVLGKLSLAQKSEVMVLKISRTVDQRGRQIDTLVSILKK